jgi:hypothetical protein
MPLQGQASGMSPSSAMPAASATAASSRVGGSFPWVTYDMWLDFEQDTLGARMSATELANSTHGVKGSWDISSTNNLCATQSAAEDLGHAATGDPGTRGMAYDLGPGGQGYIQWNLPTDKSSLSFGIWYKTEQPGRFVEGPHFITLFNLAFGPMLRLSDERSGVTNARQVRVSPLDNVAIGGISDNTWYWFTMRWVQHGAGTASVYDTNLNLVGTVNFTDPFNSPAQAILLGNSIAEPGQSGQTIYFDDLIVDYMHANFPVLPKKP